jgi:hypothetical protein
VEPEEKQPFSIVKMSSAKSKHKQSRRSRNPSSGGGGRTSDRDEYMHWYDSDGDGIDYVGEDGKQSRHLRYGDLDGHDMKRLEERSKEKVLHRLNNLAEEEKYMTTLDMGNVQPVTGDWEEDEKRRANEKNAIGLCAKCSLQPGIFRCSKCQNVSYCCKDCQISHWATHKLCCAKKEAIENKPLAPQSNSQDPTEIDAKNKTNSCAQCNLPASNCCAKCKSVYYCSRECQTSHWSTHKKICKLPLRKILLKDLLVGAVHEGCCLEVTIVSEPFKLSAVHFQSRDDAGAQITTSVYGYPGTYVPLSAIQNLVIISDAIMWLQGLKEAAGMEKA